MTASTISTFPLLPSLAGAIDERREAATPIERLPDQVLLERVARGDQDAFTVLYRRYERPVFGVLLRFAGERALAEELLQEAFTRVWLGASSHDPARGEVKPWVFTIALNTARSELARKRHRMPHVSIDDLAFDLRGEGAAETSRRMTEVQQAAMVKQALRSLPDFMQEVVVLRCSRELSFAEIAEVTGAPQGTLRSRFHRAVVALRQALDQTPGGQP